MVVSVSHPSYINAVLAFITGVISAYSSSSGVVLPTFLPLVPKIIEQLGGGDSYRMAIAIAVGSTWLMSVRFRHWGLFVFQACQLFLHWETSSSASWWFGDWPWLVLERFCRTFYLTWPTEICWLVATLLSWYNMVQSTDWKRRIVVNCTGLENQSRKASWVRIPPFRQSVLVSPRPITYTQIDWCYLLIFPQ